MISLIYRALQHIVNCITLKDWEEAPTSVYGGAAAAVALLDRVHSQTILCIVNILHLIGFSIPEALMAGRDPIVGIISSPTPLESTLESTPLESLAGCLMARTPVENLTHQCSATHANIQIIRLVATTPMRVAHSTKSSTVARATG